MRQNTSSPRACLPFQCFHTCTAPGQDHRTAVLFARGAAHRRLRVNLVTFPQHEPVRVIMNYGGSSSGIHRFTAPIGIDSSSNFQRYCFKIELLAPGTDPLSTDSAGVLDSVWYSSLGMSRERPLLQHCFAFEVFNTHPQWVPKLICYQVLPDRFASSQGFFSMDGTRFSAEDFIKPKDLEYIDIDHVHCGGDLDGLGDMLPYLRRLGCDGVYLTSLFDAPAYDKSATRDYFTVDAHFGGNGALKRLRALASGYEMKLLLAGAFDYSGDDHPWFDRQERTGKGALHHSDSPYREFYTFNSEGEAYYSEGRPQQPKLDYSSREVRHLMYKGRNSFARKWTQAPYGIDGWVVDGAARLGDHGTARNNLKRLTQLCQAVRQTHLDCLMLGNFNSDARYALNSVGCVDGAVNYTGFTSPLRAFFGGVDLSGCATPYTGEDLRRTCEEYSVGVSQQTKLCLLNQLDNPDLPRFYNVIGRDRNLYLAALAAMYTWRGIPCLYQGDELGDMLSQYQIGPRSPLPFTLMKMRRASPHSADLQSCLTELANLRRSNSAITHGSMVFICAGGAHFGFIRLFDNRFCITLVNASRQQLKVEQGSMLLPLLAAMYLPEDCQEDTTSDGGETLLIPLSGRNVRRTDHGEGLEALYGMLSRENLSVHCYGATRSNREFEGKFIHELTCARPLTLPARSTVIVNNASALRESAPQA